MRWSWALPLGSLYCIATTASPAFSETQQPLSLSTEASHDVPILSPSLDAVIVDILKEFKTPGGVGVAVVHRTAQGNWKLESKGYGNATIGGDKVTSDTLFGIGSNSKLFDVLATGLLISNETLSLRISWTSKIASIIPIWKLMDPVASSESTILDLMSHRTGLPRHDLMAPLSDPVADVIARLRYLRPSADFREHFQYNNHMYTVLSYLPKALLNATYETYVRDNIFDPLGMDSTTFFFEEARKSGRLADGFFRDKANQTEDPFAQGIPRAAPFWDRNPGTEGHAVSGAGGVISNAHDMAIWLHTLLTEGKSQSNESVIPAAVVRKAATGLTVYKPVAAFPELSPIVYGGGQMRGTYRGYGRCEHGGSTPGFKSQVSRIPTQDLGVVVMSNEEDFGTPIMETIKYRIIDEVLQLEPIDWMARYRANAIAQSRAPPALPRRKDAELPSVPFAALAGTYSHPAYGSFNFCLFSANKTVGASCVPIEPAIILPGVVDPEVPSLIAKWDTMVTNYVQFSHYSGNTFNSTGLLSNPTEIPSEFWVQKFPGMLVEFETDGGKIGFGVKEWGLLWEILSRSEQRSGLRRSEA
ncbi:beta-lactamase/transpeptidase-like protein [Mycena sp. CBHHK59/15]|nr:beta-lactamase/transpeptidase-like protein [Mycena sp. CBHHK59/15]